MIAARTHSTYKQKYTRLIYISALELGAYGGPRERNEETRRDEKVGEEKTEVRADGEGDGHAVNLPGPLDGRRIRQLVRIHCIVFPPFSSSVILHIHSSGRDLMTVCAPRAEGG